MMLGVCNIIRHGSNEHLGFCWFYNFRFGVLYPGVMFIIHVTGANPQSSALSDGHAVWALFYPKVINICIILHVTEVFQSY